MQVIASHRVIAPSRAALASKPVRSLRRASGSVARRSADRVILSTRAMAEEGVRTCLADALGYEECVQGTRYRTDCFAECERRGYTGAPYAVCDESAPGGPDCVCEDPNG